MVRLKVERTFRTCVCRDLLPRRELPWSQEPRTRFFSGEAVRAETEQGQGTAQILEAILGSTMCSQTSDIWEVQP